jgi:hypothetical protein
MAVVFFYLRKLNRIRYYASYYCNLYVELGTAIDKSILWEDYDRDKPETSGNTKLADFAKEFAVVFNS